MTPKSPKDKKTEQIKQKILAALEQGPLRKSDIYPELKKLVPNEKALQRLLALMQEDGSIEAVGERKARVYRLPEQSNRAVSLMMPPLIRPNEIPTCKTFAEYKPYLDKYFVSTPAARGWIGFDSKRIEEYQQGQGTLLSLESLSILDGLPAWNDDDDLGSTYAAGAATTFLNQFSFNSSRLEGAVTKLAETISIMEKPGNFEDTEKKIIVLNHKQAVEKLTRWIINPEYEIERELNRSARIIKEVHAILMEGLLSDESEGEVRKGEVQISGASYLPTKNKDTLEAAIHQIAVQSGKIKNPFERSFFFLTQIAYVQAFADGNKRTARLISNIPLIASKKIPHVFTGIEEEDFDKVIVYYYETADARPLERIWVESYAEGTRLFEIAQSDFRTANLEKAELSPLRWLAIKEIVKNRATPSSYFKIAENILQQSHLKEKYPAEVLLSQIKAGLEKLYKNSIGAMANDIDEKSLTAWRKTFKPKATSTTDS